MLKGKSFKNRDWVGLIAGGITIFLALKEAAFFLVSLDFDTSSFRDVLFSPSEVTTIYVLANYIMYALVAALLIYIFLLKKEQQHSIPFKNFTETISALPIDDSICGTYFGMRSMAGTSENDKKRYYYTQHLTISKKPNGEFVFVFTGYWNDTNYPIKGSCVRVNNNLVLYGSSFGKLDSFQVAMLEYPDCDEDLTGIFSLTRMKKSASISTKIILTKLDPKKQNTAFSKKAHTRFDQSEVLDATDAISILESQEKLLAMKNYLDTSWEVEGLLES